MHAIITEPLFYFVAVPAVILLGLAKGGFSGLGIASTPLLALYLPPLEAAALILPILITQDIISIYVYRRDWDAWNLKVMLPARLPAWRSAGCWPHICPTLFVASSLVSSACLRRQHLLRRTDRAASGDSHQRRILGRPSRDSRRS